ncbi:hypothetical protein GALL_253160 [mine drainage metagenome]|uniref:Lipoprotein n=1 Tax=mine drainage metagenome TaxID=410659 RepID=A0A1J5RBL0_9ZZZZ
MKYRRLLALPGLLALAGCSWWFVKPEQPSTLARFRSDPPGLRCDLAGKHDYEAHIDAPANLLVRNDASPLKISCYQKRDDDLQGAAMTGRLTLTAQGWRLDLISLPDPALRLTLAGPDIDH